MRYSISYNRTMGAGIYIYIYDVAVMCIIAFWFLTVSTFMQTSSTITAGERNIYPYHWLSSGGCR